MRVLLFLLVFAPQDVGGAGEGGRAGDLVWAPNILSGSPSLPRSPYVPQEEPPPTPLQKALNDMEPRGVWHYNDLDAGFAEAKRTGKPLCVVFR